MMEEDALKIKKKNPFVRIILILLLFLVLVVGGGVYLVYKSMTAENYLDRNIKMANLTTKALLAGKDALNIDFANDYVSQKSIINVSTTGEDYKFLDGLALDVRSSLFVRDNYLDTSAYLKQGDNTVGANVYVEGKTVYLEAKDLGLNLSKLEGDTNYVEMYFSNLTDSKIKTDDIVYVVNKLTTYFQESLTSSNYKTSRKGLEYTFRYTIEENDVFCRNFEEKLTSDSKLLDILEIEKEDLEGLADTIKSIEILVTYNALKRETLEIDATFLIDDGENKEKEHINYKKIDNTTSRITEGESRLDILKVNDGTVFEYYEKEEKLVTVKAYDTSDDVIKLEASFDVPYEYDENGNAKKKVEVTISCTVKIEETKTSYKGNILVKVDDKNTVDVKYDATAEVRTDSVLKGDFNDAQDLTKMTNEDMERISNTLEEKLSKFEFYKGLEKLGGSSTTVTENNQV